MAVPFQQQSGAKHAGELEITIANRPSTDRQLQRLFSNRRIANWGLSIATDAGMKGRM
jgi:hypothetical protein